MANQHTSDTTHRVWVWLKQRKVGRTTREIANALGMTVPQVYGVLKRGEAAYYDRTPGDSGYFFDRSYSARKCTVTGRELDCWVVA